MIKITFHPTTLDGALKAEWDEWQEGAQSAIQDLIDAWEAWLERPGRAPEETFEFSWKNAIWTKLKVWLKTNVFNEKCAYCETLIGRFVGDAEHYRPKGRVSVKQGGKLVRVTVRVDGSGLEVAHPGYFWLAYDWQNLLPSCERCNKMQGKLDQFPVSATHAFARPLKPSEVAKLHQKPYESKQRPGWYYLRSEDLNDLERPMLLHPYFDDPQQHLRFGYAGIEAPVDASVRGQTSVDVYDLSEGILRTERQRMQELAEGRWLRGYVGPKPVPQALEDGRREVHGFIKGTEPFSAAALDWLRDKYPKCGF